MENLIITPKDKKQLNLIKAMLEEMKIKFRSIKPESDSYSENMKKKIDEAREEKRRGVLTTIDPQKLWESI